MSDNSNSTGSSGSSTNSWTLLSPEEAAVENVGPVDDGTESLGDVPSLSEEVTGAALEFKPSDISVGAVLSEEGHQVCQETSPESSEGPIPSSPTRLSPLPLGTLDPPDLDQDQDQDQESQPPVIHDIVTTSPSDNEHLGATPFVTSMDLGTPLDIAAAEPLPADPEESYSAPPLTEIPVSAEQALDTPADVGIIPADSAGESPEPEVKITRETLTASDLPSHVEPDISFTPEATEPQSQDQESVAKESLVDDRPAPETVGSVQSQEEAAVEEEEEEEEGMEPPETVTQDEREEEEEEEEEEEPSSSFDLGDTSGFDDGVRRRNIPPFDAPRPRTSDEEDEEEEVEFRLAEKKEEKPWFSLNKCIVGALILLFLGSLFLSGYLSDLDSGPPEEEIFKCDLDGYELDDGEQSQDQLSSDPQDMKELWDKLTQENQQIAQLEAQLQSQREELDSALKAVAASGDEKEKAGLEEENTKLKEELSSLPELKKELESLRARVTELSQLTADQEKPPLTSSSAPQPEDKEGQTQKAAEPERRKDTHEGGRLKEELQRQKVLLEESRKRLEGMKKDGGNRKQVRDNLEAIQKRLSDKVDRWSKKKPQESHWKGHKGKSNERDHWKKEDKKEWKHSKEGGWREKEEKKEKEWKSQKQNSHKEAWRKHQDEWERKKGERRMDREERRKEKPWHSRPAKSSHSHHQHHHHHHHHQHQQQHQHQHQHRQPQPHVQNDFWRDQEQKLRRNMRPQLGCSSVEDCAGKEGLYPVELPEFEELLEGYLSKLDGSSSESKDKIRKLTAEFFQDGVFIHDRVLFSDFAEDVADILEDMVDVLDDGGQDDDDNDSLEEEMEEFEREALWKFAATA